MPTKNEFLDAWEGPCVEAAVYRIQPRGQTHDLTRRIAKLAYRAIAPKLLEGLAEQFPIDELNYVLAALSDSRRTHREWIEYLEAQPGRLPPRFVQGLDEHRRIVADYDRAVKVIESLRKLTLLKEQSE